MSKGAAIKRRIRDGEPIYSLLHGLASTTAAELAALAGYDAVIIDDEHGPGGRSTHLAIAQAVAAGGAACMMRLASQDPVAISQALDLGMDGLIVPGVESGAQAAEVVKACCFPPHGSRGYGLGMARAAGYGLFVKDYDASVRDGIFLAVIIESGAGVEQARAIASTPGVDVVIVGLQDLSADLGVPGDTGHPSVRNALASVEAEVLACGKAIGTVVHPGATLAQLLDRGHRFITLGADTRLLGEAMRRQLDACPDRRA